MGCMKLRRKDKNMLTPKEISELDEAKFKIFFEQVCSSSKVFKVPNSEGVKVPVELSPSQKEIYFAITTCFKDRVIALTTTRFGKSFTVALAVIMRMTLNPNEKWTIVAPTEPKAQIIMKYIREHLNDDQIFKDMIDNKNINPDDSVDMELSRKRIVFANGSSVSILSADADSKSEAGQKLMGHGVGKGLIIDESCELDDAIYAKAYRMLGDNKESVLIELGNPWKRNHFYKSYINDDYYKIIVDWRKALAEGRYTEKFIEESRQQAFFDVLYECKFPDADAIDSQGYLPLFTESLINGAYTELDLQPTGRLVMGVDVSYKGKDSNVWVLRGDGAMKLLHRNHDDNPLNVVSMTMELARQYNVDVRDIYMDASGGGNIIWARFKELGYNINGIGFGDKPNDPEKFRNIKAEGFFNLYEWINKGGKLVKNNGFKQLLDIKYKTSNERIQIITKEELRKQGILSPDVADAAMLTCIGGTNFIKHTTQAQISRKRLMQPVYQ